MSEQGVPQARRCERMNYRHAYHAGNFADVLKHLTLALVVDHLRKKDAPFRVVDTHAGSGRYELSSVQSAKTGEWRSGIGRLLGPDARKLPAPVAEVMAPYLDAVRAVNSGEALDLYPGSPLVARHLLREQDVLVANELHPDDRSALEVALGRDRRVKVLALDGWVALKSLLPPKERRGVTLIDPPFEKEGEWDRLATGLREALRRFESGVHILWYPIKDPRQVAAFHSALVASASVELLSVQLMVRSGSVPQRLNGCGMIVANPPFTLRSSLAAVLPELTFRLAEGPGACNHIGTIEPNHPEAPIHPVATRRRKTQEL